MFIYFGVVVIYCYYISEIFFLGLFLIPDFCIDYSPSDIDVVELIVFELKFYSAYNLRR